MAGGAAAGGRGARGRRWARFGTAPEDVSVPGTCCRRTRRGASAGRVPGTRRGGVVSGARRRRVRSGGGPIINIKYDSPVVAFGARPVGLGRAGTAGRVGGPVAARTLSGEHTSGATVHNLFEAPHDHGVE